MARPAPEDPFIGTTLPGGYHILDLIAVGGMGRVYRAEQSVLGRTVAVKVIHPHLLSDDSLTARFLTEARAASQLNHPGSVAVFDFGRVEGGQPYMVMEFLRGLDLECVIRQQGPLDLPRVVDILRQVLAALEAAHELGIVHRDMKPPNVILEPRRGGGDFVKVVDFGLAKLKLDARSNVTTPGLVCGTPEYMAPEQGRGDPADHRSDIYAVGVMLFELLTGRVPFEADSPTSVVMMQISVPPPDPRALAPDRQIPDALCDVCLKALAKKPEDRFQDASDFADALERALRPTPTATPVPPEAMVQCAGCSALVRVAKFCGECGASLSAGSRPSVEAPAKPFVGREADLVWLDQRRHALDQGLMGCLVVGEPGVGKTRLLADFAARAAADGDRIVEVGPDPWWAEAAYWTLRRAICALAELDQAAIDARKFEGASSEARRGLDQIFESGLSQPRDRRSPAERRMAVAEALRWALLGATSRAEQRRVVITVDELSRVDSASRSAIADALNEPLPGARVLIVGARIPGFDPGWGRHELRMLGGLTQDAIARLWPEKLGPPPELEPEDQGVLPLYVEQLVRFSLEGGNNPPRRLADLMAHRVDTLEPDARRALQAVAVLGDRVDPELLDRIVPLAIDSKAALEVLVKAGMLERDERLVSATHPLLRELVLAGTPAAVRRELHARALGVCEQLGAPIEAQAMHAYEAQEAFQALLLLEQIAGRAEAWADRTTEIQALRRGLEIARREISRGDLDDPLRAVLIFGKKLAAALIRGGDYSDADGVLREALDVAAPNGAERAHVLGMLANVAHQRKRPVEALAYIDRAIESAQQSGDSELVTTLSTSRRAWAS
jgi:tRNA A-37 threonylcarbamoyl transferase component Bud32/tetratricopeptide (TPR) repeat protein